VVVKKAELLKIAVKPEQYPPQGPPEIAFAGRSNVGKSSLLNLLTNRKNLARVSGNPGKTQTINFYSINDDEFRIVDLPGYGYARVSKSITSKWGGMVESYLTGRKTLKAVCLLVDIRHVPTGQDKQLTDFLLHHDIRIFVVATKSDKVSSNGRMKQISVIGKELGIPEGEQIICVSALKRTGTSELLSFMEELL
jgi:GTP-binding protein